MKNTGEIWLLIKICSDGRISANFFLIASRDLRELMFQKSTSTKFFPGYATISANRLLDYMVYKKKKKKRSFFPVDYAKIIELHIVHT